MKTKNIGEEIASEWVYSQRTNTQGRSMQQSGFPFEFVDERRYSMFWLHDKIKCMSRNKKEKESTPSSLNPIHLKESQIPSRK